MSLLDKLFGKSKSESTIETKVVQTKEPKHKEQKPETVKGDEPLVGK